MKKHTAIFIGFFVIIFTILSLGDPYTVHADEQDRLEIKVEAGLNGMAKEERGYPVTLTITNDKEDFSGDLVITLPIGNKIVPVDIASGTTKTISFSMQATQDLNAYGYNQNQNEQVFRLFEGDWESGNEVKIDSSLTVTPTYIQPNQMVIGVLSDQPDSLNYIKLTSFNGNNPEVINLEAADIPEDALGLDVLDLLVINDFAVAQLPEQIQESIKRWVRDGGTIVTGSEPGLDQQFGTLAELLPLTVSGKETVQELEGFEEPFQANNLELFTGEVDQEAVVLYKEDAIPLVVNKSYGKGAVTQLAFDLGHPALADWKGNDEVWTSIGNENGNIIASMNGYGMNTFSRLADMSKSFPTLANFKISTLSILFAAYLLIILPVLYFILKRIDKREWAWLVIPGLAIILSIGLYTLGAKDRGGAIKTNMISVISVNEQGIGSGEGAVSLLSKESGSYTLTMNSEYNPFPAEDLYGPQRLYSELPFLEEDGNETNVHYQQVEFWSPRSAAVNHPVKEYGQFTSNLSLTNEQISGQITNEFDYDFEDVYLISGNSYHEIGEIAAGESKEISFDKKNNSFFEQPTEQVAYQIFGNQGYSPSQNVEQIKAELLSMALRNEIDRSVNKPLLIGFTSDSLYPVTVNGEETVQNNRHLFIQPTEVQLPSDETSTLSTEIRLPEVSVNDGRIYHNGIGMGEPYLDLSAGSYLLTYELPESLIERSFQLEKLSFSQLNQQTGFTFSLYNVQSDTFEEIDQTQASFNENAHEKYMKDNSIVLRISSVAESGIEVPAVTIEGVINP
ncbi:hypothetical protein SAMN04487944_11533 [Gracilibacillus ureilyticus]|uniref:Uncharacterized protein n=1 Tax=Gracilibacillus ureilyticus TaxID=531814 RepID=A0A1H9TW79_9BACI|nr:hypothetical protein [Gracilibacillus ureilyticus]SES01630.1 hypothetical protein SAMN04487944_11533 [Gracilibacillus ureilyticus]